jgi:hypothetical protein
MATLRLWRRKRIVPGLRLNLSKSGLSASIGRRGVWYTVGPAGERVTAGLPGSGLFVTEKLGAKGAPGRVGGVGRIVATVVVMSILCLSMTILFAWNYH